MKVFITVWIVAILFGAANAQDLPELKARAPQKVAGLSLPSGFAFQQLALPPGGDVKGVTKLRMYALESKRFNYKVLISHTQFLELNVTRKIFEGSENAMLTTVKSSIPPGFKVTTTPLLEKGLNGRLTSLRMRENTEAGNDHLDVYAFYSGNSVWFITFMCPDKDYLKRLSQDFMSEVRAL